MLNIKRLEKQIREDNTLTLIEETGRINIDYIDENLEDFIEALENTTGKEYTIKTQVGGRFIEEYK